jgi:hypothetical protein
MSKQRGKHIREAGLWRNLLDRVVPSSCSHTTLFVRSKTDKLTLVARSGYILPDGVLSIDKRLDTTIERSDPERFALARLRQAAGGDAARRTVKRGGLVGRSSVEEVDDTGEGDRGKGRGGEVGDSKLLAGSGVKR